MSLFGAATSGVDPQTGSYLSNEQRKAMFQSSRGRGGGGGNTPSGGGGVAPQNAIVVANKMASVVQTLQTNTQETVQAVNVRVQENAQNIENLYKSVQDNRSAEAKVEKEETKDLKAERESALRTGKEKLIEGLSSAVAGLANVGRKAAEAALAPVMGFWDKLKAFLAQLALAFVIKNLPTIINKIEEFTSWLGDFENWFPESLTSLRGVWSIADNIIRAMWRGFRGLAGRIFRLATWLGGKIFNLTKRIFTSVGGFVKNVIKKLVSFVKNAFSRAWRGLTDAFKGARNLLPGGGTPSPRGGQPQLPGAKSGANAASDAGGPLGKLWKGLSNFGRGALNKGSQLLQDGGAAIKSGIGNLQKTTTGIEPKTPAQQSGWIKKALAPLGDVFPAFKGAMGGLGKLINGALKVVPGIGFAIDLALNKGINGDDWTTAIIAALGSSIAGGIGAAGGAKIGGGVGFALGSAVPLIGNIAGAAIGALLGAIIGGIAGGALGDMGARSVMDATGIGESAQSENKGGDDRTSLDSNGPDHDSVPASTVGPDSSSNQSTNGMVQKASSGSSTPEGMQEPDGGSNRNTTDVVQLEPTTVDARTNKDDAGMSIPGLIEDSPFWETADPAVEFYRDFARQEYELAY